MSTQRPQSPTPARVRGFAHDAQIVPTSHVAAPMPKVQPPRTERLTTTTQSVQRPTEQTKGTLLPSQRTRG